MSLTLRVYMDGVLCGVVTQSAAGDVRFVYDEAYRSAAGATPLSLSMPLVLAEHRKRVVVPYLEGLLTDNLAARRAIAQRFDVNPQNPVAIVAHVGTDVAGALQFTTTDEPPPDASEPRAGVRSLSAAEVEAVLLDAVERYRDGRAGSVSSDVGRFSLAGAQPKVALCRDGAAGWATPLGSTPSTHILKPVTGEFRRLDVVEHLTMRAAALMGATVAASTLETIGSFRVFVSTRYDRERVAGRWRRLHQEDLGQALAVHPSKKYQRDDGGPGVGEVARLLRGLPVRDDREQVAWSFFEGLMVNTVLRCTDAHIKNYSVLLEGSRVRLAPLYDLATFAPHAAPGQVVRSAMRIGGEFRFDAIGERQCLDAARVLGLDLDRASAFVRGLRGHAVEAFAAARDELVAVDADTRAFADHVVDSIARIPLLGAAAGGGAGGPLGRPE